MEEQTPSAVQPTPSINQEKLNVYMEKLKLEQNFPMGLIAGLIAAIVSAALWAAITVATKYQIGYMAIAVGFLVGYAMQYAGKGIDKMYGYTGAVLSLFGCLLGNFFSLVGFAADSEGVGYFEMFSMINYSAVPDAMMESFNAIDLLFYGLAIYEGYKFSFRKITEEEIIQNAS